MSAAPVYTVAAAKAEIRRALTHLDTGRAQLVETMARLRKLPGARGGLAHWLAEAIKDVVGALDREIAYMRNSELKRTHATVAAYNRVASGLARFR